MSGVDIVLIIIILLGIYSGYKQGFLVALFSFLGIVVGILGGFKLMGIAMIYLADEFNIDKKVLPYVAFAIVFIAIVIAISLIARMLKASMDKTFLGQVDSAAGACLGLFKAVFMASIVLWIIDSLHINFPENWTKNSWLLPLVADLAPLITSWIGSLIPAFNDIF